MAPARAAAAAAPTQARRVAVIGAGWAGLAAAVEATRRGHRVSLFESSRQPGGRARALAVDMPDGSKALLDNGQHILAGAYTDTLSLMRRVGVDPAAALMRIPLTLRFPDGTGLALPDWPAPLDAAWGILRTRGWTWADRMGLLQAASRWRAHGFACDPAWTVERLCAGLPGRVVRELIDPLCVSALNTPMNTASAQVFLTVMRDALLTRGHGGWAGSNLLIPRTDLGALLPAAAAGWLAARGGVIRLGHRVASLATASGADGGWLVDEEAFDCVILACTSSGAARLARQAAPAAAGWWAAAECLPCEAITTVYAQGRHALPLPMIALRSGPGAPAQFVFDRSRLGGPAGLLAFVVSASQGDVASLQAQVLAQAATLGWDGLTPVRTVTEKRATFACTAGLKRPGGQIAPGLLAAGDYIEGPYPATLEGAVRSGLAAAACIS